MTDDEVEDFVTADELSGYPGAPFTPAAISIAISRIREACGWHVAPVIHETLLADGDGSWSQWLPTRHVVAVHSVQVYDHGVWRDAEDWDPETGWSTYGTLYFPASTGHRWPLGPRTIKVDLEHGFPVTPALKALVAYVTQSRTVVQESLGARSATFSDLGAMGSGSAAVAAQIRHYSLGTRP